MDEKQILTCVEINYAKNILENNFSDDDDSELNLVGIITMKNKNIFFTDKFNNTRKMDWTEKSAPKFLCSGLVMQIIGKKKMDHDKPTDIIVKDYKFPNTVIKRNLVVSSPVAICHTLSSNEKIDQIVKKVDTPDIYIMGANVDVRLMDVINYLSKFSKTFHFMPGSNDLVSRSFPLCFQGFRDGKNVRMKELPHQQEGILFLNNNLHLKKMIRNSNLSISLIEAMELIYDSKQPFFSNRILRRKEMTHDATILVCDGDDLFCKPYKDGYLVVLPLSKILLLNNNVPEFIDLE